MKYAKNRNVAINDKAFGSARRVAVAATTAIFAAVSGFALVQAPTASAACSPIEVVWARGTGQPPGLGREGDAFVSAFKNQVSSTVGVYAVDYPATDDFFQAAAGANDASAHVQGTVANCPDTKIVLGGYSQGAGVIDAITTLANPLFGFDNTLPPEVADHVVAVAVFGNPTTKLGRPLTTLSPVYGPKAIDLCNGADPVCSPGDDAAAHSLYVQTGLIQQGADFAAARV